MSKDEGCEFVFISDLILKENYEIKHDGTQCKKEKTKWHDPDGCAISFFGEGGGSRTPVQKAILINFSERRRSLTFPHIRGGRQPLMLSSR